MKKLFQNQAEGAPRSRRGQQLVHQKLVQLDELIERVQHMKWMLQRGLECDCQELEECVVIDRAW